MILALIAVFLCIGMKVECIDCRVMSVMAIAISLIVFVTYLSF